MTKWYNQNPKIDIRAVNLGDFVRQLEKELQTRSGSYITIGVQDRPYFLPNKGSGRRTMGATERKKTSTAKIAAGHEFGNSWQPRRSFLETTARRFEKSNLQKIADRNYTYVRSFLKALTTKIYDMVIECFLTSGWGTWKPLKKSYMERTGRTNPPLIDTGQLMSAVYAQYEGFTVSGKQIGGFMQSDFFNVGDSKPDKNIDKEVLKEAQRLKAQYKQIEATKNKIEEKKEKVKSALSREEVLEKVREKQKKKGEIAYLQWLGEIGDDLDYMSTEEIRKRYGI